MTTDVTILDANGRPTDFALKLTRNGHQLQFQLDDAYAGRELDEEIALDAVRALAQGTANRNQDALGFTLERQEGYLEGVIAVGSGYDRFRIPYEQLQRALEALGVEPA